MKWLSSWLVEQEVQGSIPRLAVTTLEISYLLLFKSRYGRKIAKATWILKTTNNDYYQVCVLWPIHQQRWGCPDVCHIVLDFSSTTASFSTLVQSTSIVCSHTTVFPSNRLDLSPSLEYNFPDLSISPMLKLPCLTSFSEVFTLHHFMYILLCFY